MSRALGVSKRSWSTYAKEMLAILQAVRTWRPYLLGKKIFIKTDHRSLKYFMEQRIRTSKQQNWVAKLLGYDYEIVYHPGRENSVADALSRVSGSPILNALFASHDGLVFYKTRVVVPPNTPFMHQLLKEFYDTRMGGIAQKFYWPSMHLTVKEYVQSSRLLQLLLIPCRVWDDITMDFIEGLPSSHGRNTILVIIDCLSKYAHFLPLSHPFTTNVVAEKFLRAL
ncbi:hypothetical protein AAG906_012289 [Vitis piasezkii]